VPAALACEGIREGAGVDNPLVDQDLTDRAPHREKAYQTR
jgi:hypothetical protein